MARSHGIREVRLCRRRLVLGVSGGVFAGLRAAGAQTPELPNPQQGCPNVVPKKTSQEDARHREAFDSFKRCAICRFFVPPDQFVVAEEPTTPNSICTLWAKKDGWPVGCSSLSV